MSKYFIFFALIFSTTQSISLEIDLSEPRSSEVVETDTIMTMIEFIVEWSSYEYNQEPLPKIEYMAKDLVQIYAYGDYVYAQAEFNNTKLLEVTAVYDHKTDSIYVSESIKNENSQVKVALIHELVHYLQDINGYTESLGEEHMVCSESEAYDIQILWQIINEVELGQIESFRQHSLISAMRCMGSPFANIE